jgi:hypothetical protein
MFTLLTFRQHADTKHGVGQLEVFCEATRSRAMLFWRRPAPLVDAGPVVLRNPSRTISDTLRVGTRRENGVI